MKKIYYLLFLIPFFFTPIISSAQVTRSNDFIYVGKDEIIEENFYFSGKSVLVEGKILGDMIGIASNIKINGEVDGDVLVLAQNLSIDGIVYGDLRTIANIININGEINKNVNILGESLLFGEDSKIGKDVLIKSASSEFNGKIIGNIYGASTKTIIRGEIDKNINIVVDYYKKNKKQSYIEISENAKIGGNFSYKGSEDALIKTENISGKITKNESPIKNKGGEVGHFFYLLVSTFLVAILLNTLFKEKLEKLKNIIISKNYKLSIKGSAFLFLIPLISIILLMTILAVPIAIIVLLIWGICLYLSKIVFSLATGDYIFSLLKKESANIYLKIFSGIFFSLLLFSLPFIGWVFSFVAILIGMGSFYYLIKK